MKRLIGIVCALLLVAGAGAQTKVIEKSAKKVPVWMNTALDDYLVVSVTANSLAEAQTKAMAEITERIIQAVASHVTVSQKSELSEVNINGNIDSKDAYSRVSKIKSANLPFLKGISSTNIEEIYWQKVQDKSTKKEYYDYAPQTPPPVSGVPPARKDISPHNHSTPFSWTYPAPSANKFLQIGRAHV